MGSDENNTDQSKRVDLDGGEPKKRPTGAHPSLTAHPAATGKTGSHPVQREPTPFQKAQLSSAFQGSREAQSKALLARTIGKATSPLYRDDDDQPTALRVNFDGQTPAPELVDPDVWKAVVAPVQSREGRRSAPLYQTVINQFAVGQNPRYQNDAPDKPRGHIFTWDVSRAMNCEIPHFVGAKELSLSQTVDWLRLEGPMRGWIRASIDDAHQQALTGLLVVAVPRDIKIRQLAVVLPDEGTAPDGKPWVAAAAKLRGNRISLFAALGVSAAECFFHA